MNQKAHTAKTLKLVIAANEDFEWYPTTDEIIDLVSNDVREEMYYSDNDEIRSSVLDCGAGDGRVLDRLTKGKKFAIEKSVTLIESMGSDIFIVGTEFNAQTLLDKKVEIIFSNPPYEFFDDWATKIITEANAKFVYLVIPVRWKSSPLIQTAIELRKADVTILGTFDFLNADREARAVVDVLRISLGSSSRFSGHHLNVDPFELWFSSHFDLNTHKDQLSDYDIKQGIERKVRGRIQNSGEIIVSQGLIYVLQDFYHADLDALMHNYQSVCELDSNLLYELGVNTRSVKESLKLKITSLKDLYWNELINNLSTITNKLASSSRKKLLGTLLENTHVDFNAENAHAIVLWLIRNANGYFDSQLIELVEAMTEKANVIAYKSNQRTFRDEQWRYNSTPDDLEKYKLDYRIVLERVGGLVFNYSNEANISDRAANFLNDICTIAYNIGFDTNGFTPSKQLQWGSRGANQFTFFNHVTERDEVLFEARAFKNGNLHIKFNPKFICRLNVEFGRLKGWLKSAVDAAEELDIPLVDAESSYKSNFKLEARNVPLLLGVAA